MKVFSLKKSFIFIFLYVSIFSFSQNGDKESLLSELKTAHTDTQKINVLVALGDLVAFEDANEELLYSRKAIALCTKKTPSRFLLKGFLKMANSYEDLREVDSALYYYSNYMNLGYKIGDTTAISYGHNMVGSMYIYLSDYPKALENCTKAIRIAERNNDINNEAIAANNIANIFYYGGDRIKALNYWGRSVELNKKLGKTGRVAKVLSNMSASYNELNKPQEAAKCLNQVLEIQLKTNDIVGLASTYNNLGLTFNNSNDAKKAILYYHKSLKMLDSIGDLYAVAPVLGNIGEMYYKTKDYRKAIYYYLKSDSVAILIKKPEARKVALYSLAMCYKESGDYKMAFETHVLFKTIYDSLWRGDIAQRTAEAETKYQTDRKVKENELLQAKNKVSEATIQQQKLTSYFIIAGLVFVLVISVVLFRNYRIKKKANEELSTKNELIIAQKHIVEEQKELIEEKQKEVMDSIRYARRIQSSLLATEKYIQKSFDRLRAGK